MTRFTLLLFASAPALAGDVCLPVFATVSTNLYVDGCTSAVGLCAEGTVQGPFLWGTTDFVAEGIGGGAVGEPSIVTPPIEPDTTWAYAGTFVITTAWGSLELEDVGVLDTVSGPFSEFQRVVDGTGVYDSVSGTLFSYGFIRADGMGFDGKLRGELCWPD